MNLIGVSANDLAVAIQNAGVSVCEVTPATDEVDATVVVSGLVHVTIPSFGGFPCVVRECADGRFMFGAECLTLDSLLQSIHYALSAADQEVLQQCADAEDESLLSS